MKPSRHIRFLVLLLVLLILPQWSRAQQVVEGEKEYPDDLLIGLAISGGGFRSAAFAYGAMMELDRLLLCTSGRHSDQVSGNTPGINILTSDEEYKCNPKNGDKLRTLLDSVNVISAVSGGALPASYYVYYGKEQFKEQFSKAILPLSDDLARKLENDSQLIPTYKIWIDRLPGVAGSKRVLDTLTDRRGLLPIEQAASFLDERVFREPRTTRSEHGPELLIHATDVTNSRLFTFSKNDLQCMTKSDPPDLTIGKQVAATAALPGLIEPLELIPKRDGVPHVCLEQFSNNDRVILADGGIYDNLAIDGLLRYVVDLKQKRYHHALRRDGKQPRDLRVLIIAINAAPPTSFAAPNAKTDALPQVLLQHVLRGFDVLTSHRGAISRSLFDETLRYGIGIVELHSLNLLMPKRQGIGAGSQSIDDSGPATISTVHTLDLGDPQMQKETKMLAALSTISWFPVNTEISELTAAAQRVTRKRKDRIKSVLEDILYRRHYVGSCDELMNLDTEYCWPIEWLNENPFDEPLETLLQQLHEHKRRVSKKQTEFLQHGVTGALGTLVNAMESTNCNDHVYAVDYGLIDWGKGFSKYQQANLTALRRGVHVHRVFVLPKSLLKDNDRLSSQIRTFIEQVKAGAELKRNAGAELKGESCARGSLDAKLALQDELVNSDIARDQYRFRNGMVLFDYQNRGTLLIEEAIAYSGQPGYPGHYYALRTSFAFSRASISSNMRPDPIIEDIEQHKKFLHWINLEAENNIVCDGHSLPLDVPTILNTLHQFGTICARQALDAQDRVPGLVHN